MTSANLPALLQRFFTDRLRSQLGASPHTVASYRDTFRLLFVFASESLGREPSQLRVEDLDAALLGMFLDHLERRRANNRRTDRKASIEPHEAGGLVRQVGKRHAEL